VDADEHDEPLRHSGEFALDVAHQECFALIFLHHYCFYDEVLSCIFVFLCSTQPLHDTSVFPFIPDIRSETKILSMPEDRVKDKLST
jgi:hypothetical protein